MSDNNLELDIKEVEEADKVVDFTDNTNPEPAPEPAQANDIELTEVQKKKLESWINSEEENKKELEILVKNNKNLQNNVDKIVNYANVEYKFKNSMAIISNSRKVIKKKFTQFPKRRATPKSIINAPMRMKLF